MSGFDDLRFLAEAHEADLPVALRSLRNEIGEKHWKSRLNAIRSDIRRNMYLRGMLHEENAIAFGLEQAFELVDRYGALPSLRSPEVARIIPALAFAVQATGLLERLSLALASQLKQRIRGAFRQPSGMQALQLELAVATHWIQKGRRISFPELEGIGTFDFLLPDTGPLGLELECKAVTVDKGRKVHRREAIDFFHMLKRAMEGRLSSAVERGRGLSIVITLDDRLPTKALDQNALVGQIRRSLIAGTSEARLTHGVVRFQDFDPTAFIDAVEGGKNVRPIIDSVTHTRNRETAAQVVNGGAVITVLQSRKDDSLLESIFKMLDESARKQASGTRPIHFYVGLQGVDDAGLLSTVRHDQDKQQAPTHLAVEANKFLSSQTGKLNRPGF